MLEPEYFYGKSDKLVEMYQDLEDWIIKDIAMRLMAAGELSGTADRELYKLQQMGLHRQEIIKRLSKLTGKSRDEIRRLLSDSVMTSFSNDFDVLQHLSVAPTLQNNAVIMAMNAELRKTMGELNNLTKTTMLQSQKDLINMLNEVDFRVASGMQSYSSAVCEVLDRYAKNGVMIDYPTGARRTLEAAVRCCVVTSMNQTAAEVTNQCIIQNKIEYVVVSEHPGARHNDKDPEGVSSHDWWQGRAYKIRGSEPDFPNLLASTGYDIDYEKKCGRCVDLLGLHGYNCRHSHGPWSKELGVPKPKVDREKSQKVYELQQKQRAMERSIRKTKRELLAKQLEIDGIAETDVKEILQPQYDKLAYKLRTENKKYQEFCKSNDLQTQADRIKVAGFKRAQSAKANGRATAYSNSVKVPMEKAKNVGYTKRTKEELEQTAQRIKEDITQYSDRPSKWSGRIKIDNTLAQDNSLGAKEWSCDISVVDNADNGTIWHEMLHSCSCSYYDHNVYGVNEAIEEASVEWLKQQICTEKQIVNLYAYDNETMVLKALNDRFSYGTDMEFAKELFNVADSAKLQFAGIKLLEIDENADANHRIAILRDGINALNIAQQ